MDAQKEARWRGYGATSKLRLPGGETVRQDWWLDRWWNLVVAASVVAAREEAIS